MQTASAIGDVLLLLSIAFVIAMGVTILYRVIRKRPVGALFLAVVLWVAVYFVVLVSVSLLNERQNLTSADEKCFDDWCVTVLGARTVDEGSTDGQRWVAIDLQVTNRARGAGFRPANPSITLLDASGRKISESSIGQAAHESRFGAQPALGKFLAAGESFQTVRVFPAPEGATAFVLVEEGGGMTRIIIGDENSVLHRKSVFPVTVR